MGFREVSMGLVSFVRYHHPWVGLEGHEVLMRRTDMIRRGKRALSELHKGPVRRHLDDLTLFWMC